MPPHHEDQEFRERVLTVLTSVDTKMDALIGNSTTIGRVPKLESKVEDLEAHKNRALGWTAGAIGTLTFVVGLAEWYFHAGK